MNRGRALLLGFRAAVESPLWVRGTRLRTLLTPPSVPDPGDVNAELALRASRASLRRLAHVPGCHWRNTCLYRSVAACLVYRRLGVPALLRLGARNDDAERGITAHAWVVATDGRVLAEDTLDHVPFGTPPRE